MKRKISRHHRCAGSAAALERAIFGIWYAMSAPRAAPAKENSAVATNTTP
jgi:hypothetical protein